MIDMEKYVIEKLGAVPNMSGKIHCRCPFHDDKGPSFSFDLNKGLFICGSARCGVRGNFPLFFKMMENLDSWSDVYTKLQSNKTVINMDDLFARNQRSLTVKKLEFVPFPTQIEPCGKIQYLEERGINKEVIDLFQIYYGIDGKASEVYIRQTLVFPIYDLDGTYKTFQVRALNPIIKRRWQHPLGTPAKDLLYGGWLIQPNKHMFIVEGASDVWKLASYGVQAVGLFTKEATASQLCKIHELCTKRNVNPVVCLDGDAARKEKIKGVTYTDLIVMNLCALDLTPNVVYLNDTEDPGNLSEERLREVTKELECPLIKN